MTSNTNFDLDQLQTEMKAITFAIRTLADNCQDNSFAILAVLRMLEELHREIRDGFFQNSLPKTRHELYALLKDIEEEGGWPYIERMTLRSFLENLLFISENEDNTQSNNSAGQ